MGVLSCCGDRSVNIAEEQEGIGMVGGRQAVFVEKLEMGLKVLVGESLDGLDSSPGGEVSQVAFGNSKGWGRLKYCFVQVDLSVKASP